MLWQAQSFPLCTHHVFLSHCQEDRERLVLPLDRVLRQRGVIPWLDQRDYTYGYSSFDALCDVILESRHTVFLVTPAMLAQPRGWSIVELAWVHLLQADLCAAGSAQAVALPLFFLPRTDEALQRSAWRTISDPGAFHRSADGDHVAWALEHICRFLEQQRHKGLEMARRLEEDSRLRTQLAARPGLIDRITCRYPATMPSS
jgi:hypothetical protein